MTIEQAKSELMQIYGALSPNKQIAIDTVLHTIEQEPSNVREYDKDHIWYKGKQYISLKRFLQVKEPCDKCVYSTKDGCCQYDDITETIPPFKPSGDMVSRGVYEQVKWERDIAIKQLNELGYELGQKVEPCEDCVNREAVLGIVRDIKGLARAYVLPEVINQIKSLPPVNPQEPKWIPVGKKSPVAFKKVLVTYRLHYDDSIHIGIGNTKSNINGRYYWKIDEQDFNDWDILAWSPLPKPYDPQESEDKE